jgi:hypothetical protein
MAAAHTGRVNLMVHPLYEVNTKKLEKTNTLAREF